VRRPRRQLAPLGGGRYAAAPEFRDVRKLSHTVVRMSWDALAAVAELLGAFGVIASLVYLGTQVRSGTEQSRQAAAQSVQGKLNSLLETLASNPPLADAYVRGSAGLTALSPSELMQVSAMYLAVLRSYEELWHYRVAGAVDEWAWTSVRSLLESMSGAQGFRDWWTARGSWFSADFQEHVNSTLISGDTRDIVAALQSSGEVRAGIIPGAS